MHIRAATECPASTTKYRNLRVGIRVEAPKCRHQLTHHLIADRIHELLRSIERDRHDLILTLVVNVLPLCWRCHCHFPRGFCCRLG